MTEFDDISVLRFAGAQATVGRPVGESWQNVAWKGIVQVTTEARTQWFVDRYNAEDWNRIESEHGATVPGASRTLVFQPQQERIVAVLDLDLLMSDAAVRALRASKDEASGDWSPYPDWDNWKLAFAFHRWVARFDAWPGGLD